jgi:hypothetical protein
MRNNCTGLINAVSQTSEEGSTEIAGIFHSDPILPSSPLQSLPPLAPPPELLNAEPVTYSSPLSSPPRIDRTIEHRLLLEFGNRELIKWQDPPTRLALAMDYVRSSTRKKKESLRSIAAQFGVSKDTLKRHLNGGLTRQECQNEKLLPTEVLTVINFIEYLYQLGIPATLSRILEMFNELLQRRYTNELGVSVRSLDKKIHTFPARYRAHEHTVRRFVKRHSQIDFMLARSLDTKRAIQTTEEIAKDFQKKLKNVIRKYNIDERNIWNMDETGYAIGAAISTSSKVIVPSSAKHSYRTGGNLREWVSVIESVSATGDSTAPYLIFKGKVLLKRHLHQLEQAFPHGWSYGVSDNGWTDDFHAVQWLEWWERLTRPVQREDIDQLQWDKNVKPSTYRLLILDGHGSHLTGAFIAHAVEQDIILCCLPPHTSHYLQPLDVGVFTGMKTKYRATIQARADTGRVSMSKDIFIELYGQLRPQHLNTETVLTGFRNAGIIPLSLKPLEKYFRKAPINDLQRPLQSRQETAATEKEDRGLILEITGIETNLPAHPQAVGDQVFISHENPSFLRLNPAASYHAICDQLAIESCPSRRNLLIEAIRNWCERQELKVKTYKYAGNLFYQTSIEGKKAAAEAKDRSHLGLGKVIDRDAWLAIQQRKQEEESEARRLQEEKEAARKAAATAKAAAKEAAAAKAAAKRAAKALTPTPAKRRRVGGTPSQLSQVQSLSEQEYPSSIPTSRVQRSPSLVSVASEALSLLGEEPR